MRPLSPAARCAHIKIYHYQITYYGLFCTAAVLFPFVMRRVRPPGTERLLHRPSPSLSSVMPCHGTVCRYIFFCFVVLLQSERVCVRRPCRVPLFFASRVGNGRHASCTQQRLPSSSTPAPVRASSRRRPLPAPASTPTAALGARATWNVDAFPRKSRESLCRAAVTPPVITLLAAAAAAARTKASPTWTVPSSPAAAPAAAADAAAAAAWATDETLPSGGS